MTRSASTPRMMTTTAHTALRVAMLVSAGIATAQTPAAVTGAAANPVYESLVRPAAGDPIRVQPPRFTDDQSAEQQRSELARAGGDRHSADALLRPSVLAPHVLKMDRQPAAEHHAVAQRVRVVFALRGDLETFTQESFLESLLTGSDEGEAVEPGSGGDEGAPPRGESRPLTAQELQAVGIRPPPQLQRSETGGARQRDGSGDQGPWGQEQYRLVHGELFSRVRFSGVVRSFATRTDRSVLLALRFDDRFAQLPGLRNRWQRLERDEAGELRVVETGDFLGGGAAIKVTRWQADPQWLVFEAELMLLEPQAWFAGSNLLGSKLPPAIQAQVRKIRRAALRASQEDHRR